MDLRRIRYFIVLSEELHFGRAAQRLNIAQPPLSQQIRVLEDELGARLFERTNRRVELTAAGKALLPEARALAAQAERTGEVARRAQRGELGELRVGFTGSAAFSAVIPKLIFEFRRRLPEIHLRLEELSTQQQLTAMLERRLEVAFVRGTARPDLPSTWQVIRLFEDALVAVLPARHPLALQGGALSVDAFRNEGFVMYPRERGTGVYDQVIALCQQAGFAPRLAQEARESPTIVGLVAAGLGVAFVPASLSSIKVDGVAYRPLRGKGARSAMWMVLRAGELSPQEALFVRLAEEIGAEVSGGI
ncbi:LysR substrate-binding domain-containing protein [Paraburkholderia phenazinium]|jgi:DNA-binding transcriptional LysR family regulator|uniref:DNA-binding transcriptional regulator, LysR family n=1 Tax=Paraburkholderia phenazinium TaxID=60549 RepID=A0A1G8MR73_9BURK|nr:LysR substrate-binding domain-containing protein [Paraburkholderia phenazinium]SDI70549.1 DNA-binding transcriptional regulator, LysR family [Paraburkholderia phenazinium]